MAGTIVREFGGRIVWTGASAGNLTESAGKEQAGIAEKSEFDLHFRQPFVSLSRLNPSSLDFD
jgi:hypothetical protein